MLVPVVQVGPVRVAVLHDLVLVLMDMAVRRGKLWMDMAVVSIIVLVTVGVAHRHMNMMVAVSLSQHEGNSRSHKSSSQNLQPENRLRQRPGQQHAKERC